MFPEKCILKALLRQAVEFFANFVSKRQNNVHDTISSRLQKATKSFLSLDTLESSQPSISLKT